MAYLSMYRGDDRTLSIIADEDLTGSQIRFTAKSRRHDEEAIIEKSTGAGITVDTTTATVEIDAADTEDLEPQALWWDVQLTDAQDKVRTVATGRLAILPDISRPLEGS